MPDSAVLAQIEQLRLIEGAGFSSVLSAIATQGQRIDALTATMERERETHTQALRELTAEVAELRGKVGASTPGRTSLDVIPDVLPKFGRLPPEAQRTVRWAIAAAVVSAPVLVVVVRGYDRILTALLGAP